LMTISTIECWVFRAPIDSPVSVSFGSMTNRPALFLRLTASDGAWGWGEVFCNFPQVGAEHRARLVDSLFAPLLKGAPSDDPEGLRATLESRTRRIAIQSGEPGPFAQIIGAVDQALWDMAGRRAALPLWKLLAENDPTATASVRLYASGIGPGQVGETALRKKAEGYRAFKIKVGFMPEEDIRNLTELRAALGAGTTIMVDANQAWTPDTAVRRIEELAPFGLTWVEEPIPADEPAAQWRELARQCGLPLAAGENLRGEAAFREALDSGYLAFIQPDVAKWGGLSGCRAVARMAALAGAIFCPHWLGGGVGLAASLHLRAAMGPEGFAEVDANPNPLREEVFPMALTDGSVNLSEAPGHGAEPDLVRLRRFLVKH
jgi:L-alanine-DL-glutamate epimerase-like enolase superfamily enzyme